MMEVGVNIMEFWGVMPCNWYIGTNNWVGPAVSIFRVLRDDRGNRSCLRSTQLQISEHSQSPFSSSYWRQTLRQGVRS